jgi:diacylglycerol O-acyltransferase / trehalose O-mycolyltransferase / mycolyltransferase Ag85
MEQSLAPRGIRRTGRAGGTLVRTLCALTLTLVTISIAPAGNALADEPAPAQRLETFELPSPLVDTSTPGALLPGGRTVPKVNVLLPDGYDADPDRAYPVLWLLHGANGGADTWASGIEELAAGLPAIIVMPDGGTFGMYTDWWHDGTRTDPAWATYHLRLLKDTIESRYRILPERRWHAIGGISMGGQGALRYAGMLPGYFGSVVGFSAAFPNMQAPEVQFGLSVLGLVNGAGYHQIFGPATGPYAEGNNPRAIVGNYAHTRMYLTSGNGINCPQDPILPSFPGDIVIEALINVQQGLFAHTARTSGADVTARTTCGVHTFGVWDRAFVAARAWGFFEPVEEHPQNWEYRTIATEGEMWALDYEFATPASTVATFTRTGDTLSATGSGQVQITGPGNCQLTATLPFSQPLPTDCP